MKEELIKVTIDRPMGSSHPDYPDMIYPINYGYVKGIMAPDGEEQDAYVIGVDKVIHEYIGKLIAIIHRNDDIEEKWVVCAENMTFSKAEIEKLTYFQEQYYDSYIEML